MRIHAGGDAELCREMHTAYPCCPRKVCERKLSTEIVFHVLANSPQAPALQSRQAAPARSDGGVVAKPCKPLHECRVQCVGVEAPQNLVCLPPRQQRADKPLD